MTASDVHLCQCRHCQQQAEHPDQQLHQQMNLFLSRLVSLKVLPQLLQSTGALAPP
jgi:hypothetical protein